MLTTARNARPCNAPLDASFSRMPHPAVPLEQISLAHQNSIIESEEVIRRSNWAIARSTRLVERINLLKAHRGLGKSGAADIPGDRKDTYTDWTGQELKETLLDPPENVERKRAPLEKRIAEVNARSDELRAEIGRETKTDLMRALRNEAAALFRERAELQAALYRVPRRAPAGNSRAAGRSIRRDRRGDRTLDKVADLNSVQRVSSRASSCRESTRSEHPQWWQLYGDVPRHRPMKKINLDVPEAKRKKRYGGR